MATSDIERFVLGQFNTSEVTSAGQRWNKYLLRFQNMMEAYEITDQKRMKALLLHQAGEDVFTIFCTFERHKEMSFEQTCKAITDYFTPKKCVEYEIHRFRKCKQKEDETIDEFHTRLISLAENCEFENREKEVKMQIIHTCKSNKLRKKALQQSMTLQEILSLERSMEISSVHAAEMSRNEHLNMIKKPKYKKKEFNKDKTCFRCGNAWPHDGNCPAMNKKCSNCNKFNHFSAVCKSKKHEMNNVNDSYHSDHSSESETI